MRKEWSDWLSRISNLDYKYQYLKAFETEWNKVIALAKKHSSDEKISIKVRNQILWLSTLDTLRVFTLDFYSLVQELLSKKHTPLQHLQIRSIQNYLSIKPALDIPDTYKAFLTEALSDIQKSQNRDTKKTTDNHGNSLHAYFHNMGQDIVALRTCYAHTESYVQKQYISQAKSLDFSELSNLFQDFKQMNTIITYLEFEGAEDFEISEDYNEIAQETVDLIIFGGIENIMPTFGLRTINGQNFECSQEGYLHARDKFYASTRCKEILYKNSIFCS